MFRILRLFFRLVLDFLFQYARARVVGSPYDFFQDHVRNRKRAIRIRDTALQMGGVLIKVGQFLSTRVDLLPAEYIEELSLLQDEVPAVPFSDIQPVVEAELSTSLAGAFASFDREPIAAASLGQVHHATLSTGEHVAVKVQRPHISEIIEADLSAFRYIVRWLNRFSAIRKRVNLQAVLTEFEVTLRGELNYVQEGHNAERISVIFSDWPEIRVPRVYWSHTTHRVITLQYLVGVKISDLAGLEAASISAPEVAQIVTRAYLRQVLEDGFFHADPHPGNILVRPGPEILLLDFGMVGQITPQTRDNIRRVFVGVVRRDYDDVISALEAIGFFTLDADRAVLRRALSWTVDTFYEISFGELRSMDVGAVLSQVQDVLFLESFQIPANFAFLGRALGTLSGLATALDPSFQFFVVAEPYARRLIQSEPGWRGAVKVARREGAHLARTLYSLPYLTQDTLEIVIRGEHDVRQEIDVLTSSLRGVERAVHRILFGLLFLTLVLAGSILLPTKFGIFSWIAFALGVLFLIRIAFPSRSGRRRNGA